MPRSHRQKVDRKVLQARRRDAFLARLRREAMAETREAAVGQSEEAAPRVVVGPAARLTEPEAEPSHGGSGGSPVREA